MHKIHLWLSIPFGVIAFIIFISGAILLFEKDFGHIGQARVACNGRVPLAMDSILVSVENYLSGKNQITGVTTYPDPEHAYKVMLAKPAMAAIWIDQYTGEVIGNYERLAIFKWASAAHRRLFGGKTGKLIIGITTISLFAIIITGLIIWWPAKREFRKKIKISKTKGAYKFWYDIHCTGGVISALVITVCILTGLNWSFAWYREAVYGVFGTNVAKTSSHKTPAENYIAWKNAYSQLAEAHPDKEIRLYQNEADIILGGSGNQQASDTYNINPQSGELISPTAYADKEKSNHIKGWIYSLHVGAWLGWFTRIIYLVCILIGAALPVTGYYLWIKRLLVKRRQRAS